MPPIDHVTGNPAVVLMLDEALYAARPPDIDVYAEQFSALVTYPNAAAYANAVVNSGFGNLSDSALATLVLGNLINPSYGSVTPALQAAVTAALAANPANRGAVVLQLGQLLDGLVGDPVYGPAASQWRGKIAGDYATLTYRIGGYTLTTGKDTLAGYTSDDMWVGTEATLQAGDSIDGHGGNDTLKVAADGPQPAQFAGFSTTSVEQLQVTSDAVGGISISTAGMVGTARLTNDNSSTDVTFTDINYITSLALQNVSGGGTRLAFAPEAVNGHSDTLSVALSNNKTIANGSVGGLYVNGIETINIRTSGGGSKLAEVTSPGSLVRLTISGDKDLDIGKLDLWDSRNAAIPYIGGVDASSFTGKLSLGLALQDGVDQSVALVGGRGIDTLRLAGQRADYQVILGGGGKSDPGPRLHNTHASSADAGNIFISQVERLQFSDGALALDLGEGQSGYKALELLGALLGPQGPADKAAASALLAYFDAGGSLLAAAQLLLDNGYLAAKAGTTSGNTAALVNYVYANVNGQPALPDTVAALLAPINNHSTTLAQWIADMATSKENIAHVQLTGYMQTGLAYA